MIQKSYVNPTKGLLIKNAFIKAIYVQNIDPIRGLRLVVDKNFIYGMIYYNDLSLKSKFYFSYPKINQLEIED